jgi:hypothetical protein
MRWPANVSIVPNPDLAAGGPEAEEPAGAGSHGVVEFPGVREHRLARGMAPRSKSRLGYSRSGRYESQNKHFARQIMPDSQPREEIHGD